MQPSGTTTSIYCAGGQGRKVTALWWLLIAATLASAALALLADTSANRATGAILGALLALFAVGMEVYRRVYIVTLDADADGSVHVRTARFGRPRETVFSPAALRPGVTRAGAWSTGDMSGAAPWTSLRAPGQRLPFVLDLQGDVLDGAALAQITGERWIANLGPSTRAGRGSARRGR